MYKIKNREKLKTKTEKVWPTYFICFFKHGVSPFVKSQSFKELLLLSLPKFFRFLELLMSMPKLAHLLFLECPLYVISWGGGWEQVWFGLHPKGNRDGKSLSPSTHRQTKEPRKRKRQNPVFHLQQYLLETAKLPMVSLYTKQEELPFTPRDPLRQWHTGSSALNLWRSLYS